MDGLLADMGFVISPTPPAPQPLVAVVAAPAPRRTKSPSTGAGRRSAAAVSAEAELKCITTKARRASGDRERQTQLVQKDLAEIRKKINDADTVMDDDTVVAPASSSSSAAAAPLTGGGGGDDDDALAREMETTLTESSKELNRELHNLDTAQRSTMLAMKPCQVTCIETNARGLKDFFEQFGTARRDITSVMPAPFVSQFLGSGVQMPGVTRAKQPDDAERQKQRFETERELIAAHLSVCQATLNSCNKLVQTLEATGQFTVPAAVDHSADDLVRQMINPIAALPACSAGARCVGMTTLAPFEHNTRVILKAWQTPEAMSAFFTTGAVITDGVIGATIGLCVPCALLQYAFNARSAIIRGASCATVAFPFGVVAGRPAGFARSHLISHDTMPLNWPNLSVHHFVPVQREVKYRVVDMRTGAVTKHREPVFGYSFSADVLFDSATYSSGVDEHPVIPARNPPMQVIAECSQPSVPGALLLDIKNNAVLQVTIAQNATIQEGLTRLCNDLQECLAAVRAADDDSREWLLRQFAVFWDTALREIGDGPRALLGEYSDAQWSLATHSLLAVVMWRTGLCYALMNRHNLRHNINLTAFLDAHTELQKFVYSRWVELKHPPSDFELFSDATATINTETVCACLRRRSIYPIYAQPYLSATQQFEVRPKLTHIRRTAPIEVVRRLVLPEAMRRVNQLPRAQSRAAVDMLVTMWKPAYEAHVVVTHHHPFPDSLNQWIALAISAVALQEDFDESVWILRSVVSQWPWFLRAASRVTGATMPNDWDLFGAQIDDSAAATAVFGGGGGGNWYEPLTRDDVHTAPVEPTAQVPADVPEALFAALTGRTRYTSQFGKMPRPAAMLNTDAAWAHRGNYYVLTVLVLRVYELQRMARRYEPSLQHAFDKGFAAQAEAQREACCPIIHPNPELISAAQCMLSGKPVTARTAATAVDPLHGDVVAAAHDIAAAWSAHANNPAHLDALTASLTLVRDASDAVLDPIIRGEVPLMNADHPPSLGPALTSTAEAAYAARCALFEHLDMALEVRGLANASDTYFYADNERSIRRLQMLKPVAGTAVCEDTIPDLSTFIFDMDLLRQSDLVDFGDRSTSRCSWVMQAATAMQRACYIRDFAYKHAENCKNSEYMTWCAQSLLVSALGTYRHATTCQRFSAAMRVYEHLRPDATQTDAGRRAMGRFLVHHTYATLIALRENLMVHINTSLPDQRLLSIMWNNFAFVQQWWVPAQAEQLRRSVCDEPIAPDGFPETERRIRKSERATETAAKYTVDGPAAVDNAESDHDDAPLQVPRVFRHMRESFFQTALSSFERLEINAQTSAVVSASVAVTSLPPIANIIAPEVKRQIALKIGQTDPLEPVSTQWFRQLGVSARGVSLLVLANALHISNARPSLVTSCLQQMSRSDFLFAWTVLYTVVLHRDSIVTPLPYETARRQYIAMQYRAQDMLAPPPPSFTHMRFCHLLGCAAAQAYHVPFADAGHYGAQDDSLAINLGQLVCDHRKNADLFGRLARRSRESTVPKIAANLNATIVAAQNAENEARRSVLEADLGHQISKLQASESKNVRAVVNVMMALPCNSTPMLWYRILGAAVYRRNSLPAREGPHVYSSCTLCGTPTIHSMDRYGPNGFTCGQCDRLERSAVHGKWCFSCGAVEAATTLPPLTGEAHAAARMARSEHQPQGSTIQPRSLKAQQTRMRNERHAKMRAVTLTESADEAVATVETDTSDVMAISTAPPRAPPRSRSRSRKPTNDRLDTYDATNTEFININSLRDELEVKLHGVASSSSSSADSTPQAPPSSSSSSSSSAASAPIFNNPVKTRDVEQAKPRRGRQGGGGVSARKQNTADKDHLGMCVTDAHPNTVHIRIGAFRERVVYDDLPEYGTFTTRVVYMCQPCENKLRAATLSASEIIKVTQAPPIAIWVHGRRIELDRRFGRRAGVSGPRQ